MSALAAFRSLAKEAVSTLNLGFTACRTLHTARAAAARLTPQEVSVILRKNEYTDDSNCIKPVKSYDMNTLKSNNPIEDSHAEACLTASSNAGMLFGIFDGHGGPACGQVVAKRLFRYIAAALLPSDELRAHHAALRKDSSSPANVTEAQTALLASINEQYELVADLQQLYGISYVRFVERLLNESEQDTETYDKASVSSKLQVAFDSLDEDMSREAKSKDLKTISVAMSGSVAAVVYVDSSGMMHVASVGDCSVVLGSLSENDTWVARKLTPEHNSDNADELKRIAAEHPSEDIKDIVRGDRLLGILAPLRAFGDFRFKWDREDLTAAGLTDILQMTNYKTPPYLTAHPEVTRHRLTPRDKFVVVASDGLWDMMTPMQVIRLVGEHMSGKVVLSPLQLAQPNVKLSEVNAVLRQRRDAMKLKPADSNAATHLIRSALGGTAYGVDHAKLAQMLSLPGDMVRMFRDDITVQCVFFDSEYLRHL